MLLNAAVDIAVLQMFIICFPHLHLKWVSQPTAEQGALA